MYVYIYINVPVILVGCYLENQPTYNRKFVILVIINPRFVAYRMYNRVN